MERPTPKPSQEQMASILTATDAERIRNMSLPESKPSAEEIEAMKEAGRQEYRDNKARVIEHLKSRGLSNAAIAGIIGNIDVETGGSFDFMQRQTKSGDPRSPDIVEGGGYGLFQFDDPGRRAGHETWYKQYLEQTDKEDSAESQLDYFLDMVMSGSDTQSPFRKYAENLGPVHASTLKAYLETSTSPTDIADAITDRFEFPGKSHSDRRRATAEATFAELQPSDRVDTDPNEQYLDQPGEIADTGEGAPMEEGSAFEYVPFLRHFMKEGGMSTKYEDAMRTYPVTEEMLKLMENMTEEERSQLISKALEDARKGSRYKPLSEDTKDKLKSLRRNYNEGGIAKQMELFDDGGLMDQGGSIDPVSGNDVPPGSLQEEVRDDIPAQLSEGEFVFPADVVRFIGLNNLMQMRQQAKMGLKEMEAMGQMGNSEEATMPDDLPFDINDLDMDDEPEYNVGGFVPANQQQQQFGISGYQQAAAPTTGFAPAPVQAASAQFSQPARPQQVTTPMMQYQAPTVPFQQFIGGGVEGVEAETVQYKNEAGDIITRRINKATGELIPGQPAIPDGYTRYDPEAVEKEEVTTTPTTTETTSVRKQDDDSGERQRAEEEAKFGPGGGRLGVAGTIYGVSFDGPDGFKNTFGQVMGRTLGGKDLGSDITVRFQNEDDIFVLNGTEYNQLKTVIDEKGANSSAAQRTLDSFKGGGKARANAEEVIKNLTMMSRGDGIMDKLGLGDDDPKIQEVIKNYREHVEEQINKGNINSKGQIINPFEAGGRGGTGRGTTLGQRTKPSRSGAAGKRMPEPGGSGRGEDSPTAARDFARQQQDDPGPALTTGTAQQDFSAPSPSYASMSFGEAGRGGSSSSRDFSSQALGDKTSGRVGFDEGGLASKPKPKKTKKMKRGGLASKK